MCSSKPDKNRSVSPPLFQEQPSECMRRLAIARTGSVRNALLRTSRLLSSRIPRLRCPRAGPRGTLDVSLAESAFWTGLILCTIASSRVGALFMRDTLPAVLVTVAGLLLSVALVPIGIGVSAVRRRWSPLLLSGLRSGWVRL